MSKENLQKFIKDANENKQLQSILAKGGDMADSPQSQIEYVVKEAKAHGYDFTADEFLDFIKKSDSKSGDISDDDLSNVAGGTGPIYKFVIKVKRGFEDLVNGPPSLGKRFKRQVHDVENALNLDNKWYREF